MRELWAVELRGGAYDGLILGCRVDLEPVLVVWMCGPRCGGHGTFDPSDEGIVLAAAACYRRADVNADERHAFYDSVDLQPGSFDEQDAREATPTPVTARFVVSTGDAVERIERVRRHLERLV